MRTVPTCNNCDRFVSTRFLRVFGDNHDEVDGCLHCRTAEAVMSGQVAK